jgi:hypothetical protein
MAPPNCHPDFSLVRALWLAVYRLSSLQSQSFAQRFPSFWGSLNKHLVDKWFPTDTDMKQSNTFRLHTLGTDSLYPGIQTFVPWWDKRSNVSADVYHPLHTCYAQAKVRIKLHGKQCLLRYFSRLACIATFILEAFIDQVGRVAQSV